MEAVREGFLPAYFVETADHRLLVYTAASEDRDEFLEGLYGQTRIGRLIEAQRIRPPAEVWREWLGSSTVYAGGRLDETADGWQVVMDAATFGAPPRIPLVRIGSYQFRDNQLIRIWCDAEETRRRALLERSLGIATLPEVTSVPELETRIGRLSRLDSLVNG